MSSHYILIQRSLKLHFQILPFLYKFFNRFYKLYFKYSNAFNDFAYCILWLERKNITGLFGVDTRALTRKVRNNGVLKAMVTLTEITDENKTQYNR